MPLPHCALKKHSGIWYCVRTNVNWNWKPATQEWRNKLYKQNGSALDKKKKTQQSEEGLVNMTYSMDGIGGKCI